MSRGVVGSGGHCGQCPRDHYAKGLCKPHYLQWWFKEQCEARRPVRVIKACVICKEPIEVNAKRIYRAQFICGKKACVNARARDKWSMYKLRKGDDIRNNERVRRREKKNIPEESIRG